MAKPPPETPHSDIDGVDQTGRPPRSVQGDPGKQLDRARRLSVGRPDSDASRERDERSG